MQSFCKDLVYIQNYMHDTLIRYSNLYQIRLGARQLFLKLGAKQDGEGFEVVEARFGNITMNKICQVLYIIFTV